jgi:acetyl/propionyl-CoA carboxylase alpha subunit
MKAKSTPMPGLLVDVAVQVGQKQGGRRANVRVAVDRMKMENVLFAMPTRGWKVLANKGERH